MINLADLLMIIHFLWVLFMVLGLPLGLWFGSAILRWFHFIGMVLTAFFAASGMDCPLTAFEETLRRMADPEFTYSGSFLARSLSNLLYPQMDPWIIRALTVVWGLLTLVFIIVRPPGSALSGRKAS
jgi:hypothetical protein